MAEARTMQITRIQSISVALLPLLLWTSLLLILPYSASFGLFLKIVLWGIPAYLFPMIVGNANPAKFLLLDRPPSGKWILLSAAFLITYTTLVNGGNLAVKPVSLSYVLSAVWISPLIEEVAFRGVLLQVLHRSMRWGYANVATAVLFMLYHIPLWLARGQSISLLGCLWVIFFAVWMGYLLSQSRSLWTCVIIHAAQNLLLGIL